MLPTPLLQRYYSSSVYGCHRKSMNTVLVIMPTAQGTKRCVGHTYMKIIESIAHAYKYC